MPKSISVLSIFVVLPVLTAFIEPRLAAIKGIPVQLNLPISGGWFVLGGEQALSIGIFMTLVLAYTLISKATSFGVSLK